MGRNIVTHCTDEIFSPLNIPPPRIGGGVTNFSGGGHKFPPMCLLLKISYCVYYTCRGGFGKIFRGGGIFAREAREIPPLPLKNHEKCIFSRKAR